MVFPNGNSYLGELKNNQFHGKGILTLANGDTYQGDFKNNLRHGHGKIIYSDGYIYEGEYQNDLWNGKGKLTYINGNIYEGDFKNGLQEGLGKTTWTNGYVYEGEYKNGKQHGYGKIISLKDGLEISGFWENNFFSNDNNLDLNSIISQDFFAKFLLAKNKAGIFIGLWEKILSNLLKTIDNPTIEKNVQLLKNTCQYLSKEPSIAADLILKELQELNNPCLIPYGCRGHAMGLLLTSKQDHLKITVFNSGWGLRQYHEKMPSAERLKFRTKINFLIPKEKVTKEMIVSLLTENTTIDEAYQKLIGLENKNIQTSSLGEVIWQAPQKSENCGLEWIFSFFKNTLPLKDYIALRITIFETALKGLELNTTLATEDKEAYQALLQQKIEKRKLLLKNLCQEAEEQKENHQLDLVSK